MKTEFELDHEAIVMDSFGTVTLFKINGETVLTLDEAELLELTKQVRAHSAFHEERKPFVMGPKDFRGNR